MSRNPKLNASGYRDMTAFEAINNTSRDEKRGDGSRPEPQAVFICSPFAGDMEANTQKALEYCRFAVSRGRLPLAPHCYFPRFMDEGDPAARELGISFGIRLLGGCDELWAFGPRVSEGMKREIHAAEHRGIRIRHFNENMEETGYGK